MKVTEKTFVNGVYFILKEHPQLVYQFDKSASVAISRFYRGVTIARYEACCIDVNTSGIQFYSVVSSVLLKSKRISFSDIVFCDDKGYIPLIKFDDDKAGN
jgi:hypothetical protein